MKKKISVLHIFSGDLWAGAEVVIFNLLSELKKDTSLNIYALSMNKGILTKKLLKEGIQTKIIDETVYPFLVIFIKAAKHFLFKKIDIIHTHRYKENLLGFLLKFTTNPNAKLVTTVHGDTEVENFKIKEKLKLEIDKFVLKKYYIVAVSEELKKRLINKGLSNNRISCIHNGIKIPEINFSRKKDSIIHIGSVGRLVPVKRYELLIDIAYKVKERINNVCFSILGDGPMKKDLLDKINRLGLSQHFKIFPPVTDPSVYYQSLDIYVNTSEHEGLPISILEAMSFSLPVVASKVGGIPEIIIHGKDGYLLEKYDKENFIKILLFLIQNPRYRIKIGKEAKKKVDRNFNVDLMAKKYKSLYLEVLRQK